MSELPREFLELTDTALAGTLGPEERAAFERHLLETPGAMTHYLRMVEVDALLPQALSVPESGSRFIRAEQVFLRRRGLLAATAALAACAVVAAGIVGLRPANAPDAYIGRTVALRGPDSAPLTVTKTRTREGEINGGFMELTLDSGVRVLLEGPAKYSVTGKNTLRLDYGKAFADVPRGAEGFTIEAPRERIIDHGTRFSVAVAPEGRATTVGVVSGEVEVRHADRKVHLYTDYSLRREGDTLSSVPFDKNLVATEFPAREFPWSLDGEAFGVSRKVVCDVTRLITGPGEFRAVLKWLVGPNSAIIRRVSLLRDGLPMSTIESPGSAGGIARTSGNAPVLRLDESQLRPGGRWTLVAELASDDEPKTSLRRVLSTGVVSFESDLALHAQAKAFLGRWKYTHDANTYVREFRADGTVSMEINGRHYAAMDGATYAVKDGILTLRTPAEGHLEQHVLRDDGTLVFLNRPYRNAHRE